MVQRRRRSVLPSVLLSAPMGWGGGGLGLGWMKAKSVESVGAWAFVGGWNGVGVLACLCGTRHAKGAVQVCDFRIMPAEFASARCTWMFRRPRCPQHGLGFAEASQHPVPG